jgi:hypothetical protein
MDKKQINARCEICMYFEPDDKFNHILKITKAKNPGNTQSYDQAAGIMGYDASKLEDMGNCSRPKKCVKETNLCEFFFHDISKN